MKLSIEQVRHVARLARLGLTDEELETLSGELSGILEYIDQLNQVDTGSIAPTARVDGLADVWRPDEVGPSVGQQAAMANAPSPEDGFFRVSAMQESG